jgi:inner membrane protein
VIDPLYTLPFLACLLLVLFQKRNSKKRRLYNILGLSISTIYLGITFIIKSLAFAKFETALQNKNIVYKQIDTRPSPLNTILWSANIETKDEYLLSNYSFFDTQPISFNVYQKNHELLGSLANNEKVKRMIVISEGWYTIIKRNDNLYYNDLRFGLLNLEPGSQDFVFQYKIKVDDFGNVTFVEQEKNKRDAKKLMLDLWERVKGN